MKNNIFEKKILDRLINVFKKNDIAYAGVFWFLCKKSGKLKK